jgi:raffinose/stachyose/melibiose transport system permease protein
MNVLKNKKTFLCFVVPALFIYTVIVFVPIAISMYFSLLKWDGVSSAQYIGFTNYQQLMADRIFVKALVNNLKYIAMVVGVQVGFGLLVAVLVTYIRRFKELIRTIYFIPSVITVVAIAQLFRSFYAYEPTGLINILLIAMGLKPVAFLSEYSTALISVSLVEGWQYIGIYMMIFYAALMSIPKDIEEAARIDGTNEGQLFFQIRLPFIMNVIGLALILSLVGALRSFAAPMLLTKGGPGNQTEILSTYMYKKAFQGMKMGYGSTISVIIVVISFFGVLFINRVTQAAKE